MILLCLHQDFDHVELLLKTDTQFFTKAITCEKGKLTSTLSSTLIPEIEELCKKCNVVLKNITHIACTHGPGSFTGLRITLATLQGLAIANKIKIYSTSSLHLMAHKLGQFPVDVSTSNSKGAFFSQSFDQMNGIPVPLTDIHITPSPDSYTPVDAQDLCKLALLENRWSGIEGLMPVYGHNPIFRKKSGQKSG